MLTNILMTNDGMKHGIKWGLIIVAVILGMTSLAKIMSFVMDNELIKIIFNSIFAGVGITIGTYFANKMLIDRMEKLKLIGKKKEATKS